MAVVLEGLDLDDVVKLGVADMRDAAVAVAVTSAGGPSAFLATITKQAVLDRLVSSGSTGGDG